MCRQRHDAPFPVQRDVAIPKKPLSGIETIRIEAAPFQLRIAGAKRQAANELSFSVSGETVTGLRAGTLILLEMKRIGKTNFPRSQRDRLAESLDAVINCVVAGNPHPPPDMFGKQELVVVRMVQPVETTDNIRLGKIAYVSICHGTLVEER